MLYRYLFWLSLPLLAACSAVDVSSNAGQGKELRPAEFFNGKLCADGVVRDYAGKQIRHFNAEIIASWDVSGNGVLQEEFRFNDGTEYRDWTLKPILEQGELVAYEATASDVPEATRMAFSGNAIHMDYTLDYQTGVDDRGQPDTLTLRMVDRMYQVADGVVVNETVMKKFGLEVGQVLLVMRQVDDTVQCF